MDFPFPQISLNFRQNFAQIGQISFPEGLQLWTPISLSEECQKPQPPQPLKKYRIQYASNLYCSTFGAPTLWSEKN